MRLGMIWLVARKEILSTMRDTRALISNLGIPLVLMPVMMIGLPLLLGGLFEREATSVTTVAVEGLEALPPEFVAVLEAQSTELVAVTDVLAAVQSGDAEVGLRAPPEFAAALAAGDSSSLEVVMKSGNMKSELNAAKVQNAATAYQQMVVADRLQDAGLDPAILQPLQVSMVDASSAAERSSGQLSWLIPFFIAIWTLTGSQMTGIDATAGEKERGTLEVLLVAPVRRIEVVVGKFLATLTFGLSASLMAIVGFLLGGAAMTSIFLPRLGDDGAGLASMMGGSLNVDLTSMLILVLSALLLAGVISAVVLAVGMFARSFKEAQSYVAPLSFVLVIPAVALQFKELIGFGEGLYLIPIFNVLVLMDDVVRGSYEASHLLLAWGSMLVVVALVLAFAYRNFNREGVLFRN